ncbi:MAG: hypothetical protein R6V85_11835 [Polyangia bacterium]
MVRVLRLRRRRQLAGGRRRPQRLGGEGGENSNFDFDEDGRCLGYVQFVRGDGFNLWRIAGPDVEYDDELDGVLVVSVARHPEGGQLVVGWHDDATCHAYYSAEPHSHNFRARIGGAVLLPPDERTFSIPVGKGGMGQFNVCYTRKGDGSFKEEPWIAEAIRYIESYDGPNTIGPTPLPPVLRPYPLNGSR